MNIDDRNNRSNVYTQFRVSVDIGMGALYIFISFYAMQVQYIIEQYGKKTVWGIGGLFIFYGLFRILRALYKIWQMIHRVK